MHYALYYIMTLALALINAVQFTALLNCTAKQATTYNTVDPGAI
jgi:hypothetical protein